MNFYTDNNESIKTVSLFVHPTKIIVDIEKERKLYSHMEYQKVIDDISKYFNDKDIESVKEYLEANLEIHGIKTSFAKEFPKKPSSNQYSLF